MKSHRRIGFPVRRLFVFSDVPGDFQSQIEFVQVVIGFVQSVHLVFRRPARRRQHEQQQNPYFFQFNRLLAAIVHKEAINCFRKIFVAQERNDAAESKECPDFRKTQSPRSGLKGQEARFVPAARHYLAPCFSSCSFFHCLICKRRWA